MTPRVREPYEGGANHFTSLGELLLLEDEAFVEGAYNAILGRPADEPGLRHYVLLLQQPISKLSIIRELANSDEARTRFEHLDLDSLANGAFVDKIYERLLGRDSDPAGRHHYAYVLGHGAARKDVIAEIENSVESQARNPRALAFKRELAGLVVDAPRDKGVIGRVRGWFSVRRRTVILTEQIADLVRENNLKIAVILNQFNGNNLKLRPTVVEPIVQSSSLVSNWSKSYAEDDLTQTLDEILRKVRFEVASMKKN